MAARPGVAPLRAAGRRDTEGGRPGRGDPRGACGAGRASRLPSGAADAGTGADRLGRRRGRADGTAGSPEAGAGEHPRQPLPGAGAGGRGRSGRRAAAVPGDAEDGAGGSSARRADAVAGAARWRRRGAQSSASGRAGAGGRLGRRLEAPGRWRSRERGAPAAPRQGARRRDAPPAAASGGRETTARATRRRSRRRRWPSCTCARASRSGRSRCTDRWSRSARATRGRGRAWRSSRRCSRRTRREGADDAPEGRRRALQRTIAGLEVLLGVARRR